MSAYEQAIRLTVLLDSIARHPTARMLVRASTSQRAIAAHQRNRNG